MSNRDQVLTAAVAARIDAMPLSRWHVQLVGLLGGAHFFDAFDATALAFVLPVLAIEWHLSPGQAGLLISGGYAGQLVGAVAIGFLAERVGRLSALQLSLALLAVTSVACAFAPGFLVLVALRAIQGIGLGGETPVGATYMNETCPAAYRGRMVVLIQLMFALGSVVSALLAVLLIPAFGWPSLFLVGGAPVALAAVLRILLPESPRWLAARGRDDEARRALTRMERGVYRSAPPQPLLADAPVEREADAEPRQGIGLLLSRTFVRRTLSAWLIAFCASLTGYGLISWMPTIYRTIYHLPLKTTLSYSLLTAGGSTLVGGIMGMLLMDRLGRKRTITLGFLGAGAGFAAMTVATGVAPPLVVMLLASATMTFLSLPLAGIYLYTPELYPTEVRALGMGVASAWLRIASIVGPLLIGMLLTLGSVRDVYILFAATALAGMIGTVALAVESHGHEQP